MKKLITTILLVTTLCTLNAYTQEKTPEDDLQNYEIEVKKAESGGLQFDFVSKDTREVVKTFNSVTDAPYQNLDFPVAKRIAGYKVYDLSKADKGQAFDFFDVPETEQQDFYFGKTYTLFDYHNDPGSYTAVSYSLYNSYREPNVVKTTAIAFNAKGEEIFRLENVDFDCRSPVVTDDGKYFAFRQGTEMGEDGIKVVDHSVKIYDTSTGELIVDRKLDEGYSRIAGPVLAQDKIKVVFKNGENVRYLLYDFNKRILYSKVYSIDVRKYLTKINKDSFIFDIPNSGRKIDTFKEDFEKEEF